MTNKKDLSEHEIIINEIGKKTFTEFSKKVTSEFRALENKVGNISSTDCVFILTEAMMSVNTNFVISILRSLKEPGNKNEMEEQYCDYFLGEVRENIMGLLRKIKRESNNH